MSADDSDRAALRRFVKSWGAIDDSLWRGLGTEFGLRIIERGVEILDPPTDQPWAHRTRFFRDPEGNLLEIYADL
jgi:hypothetical protein